MTHPAVVDVSFPVPGGVRQFSLGAGAATEVDAETVRVVAGPLLGGPVTSRAAYLRERWRPHPTTVRIRGRRIDHLSTAARIRRGLGVVSGSPVAAEVAVRDHLAVVASPEEVEDALAGAPLLAGRGGDPAGLLSGGERRVLSWLRVLLQHPMAVLLDHPTAGLDPDALRWAAEVVRRWRVEGVAVLLRAGRPEERAWLGPSPTP